MCAMCFSAAGLGVRVLRVFLRECSALGCSVLPVLFCVCVLMLFAPLVLAAFLAPGASFRLSVCCVPSLSCLSSCFGLLTAASQRQPLSVALALRFFLRFRRLS